MSVKDVLGGMAVGVEIAGIGLYESVTSLLFSLLVGIYIFVVYRLFIRKTLYNINLNIALMGMTVITAAVMLTIQSNLVLSLGMVGALSIVRYRTAIKDPMDLFFMFWSIADGIMCGARQFWLAIVVTLLLTAAILILSQMPTIKAPYVLVINGSYEGLEDSLKKVVKRHSKHYKIKARNIVNGTERIIIELKTSDEKGLLEDINNIRQVEKVSLLTYEGDVV